MTRRLPPAVRAAARLFQSAPAPPAATPPPAAPSIAADLQRLFPDGVTNVFDVGAYIGEFAAMIRGVFPTARVWCFEPFAPSYERIRTRFSGADGISVQNVGLSDRSGTAELIVASAELSTNSLISPVVTNGAFALDVPRVVVQLTTLSDCVHEFLGSQADVSIVKVDTEGNDLQVLKGGEELLRTHRIEALHIEVMFLEHFKGAAGYLEICHYLQEFGYRLYSLYDLKRNPQGQLRFGNALFLSPNRQRFAGMAR